MVVDGVDERIAEGLHGLLFSIFERRLEVRHRVVVSIYIVGGSLETEVDEFEERAEVFGSGSDCDVLGEDAQIDAAAYLLAGKLL